MSPAQADECELWQLAVLLGNDTAEEDELPGQSLEERVIAEQEDLKARMAAAGRGVRQEAPPDEPETGPKDVTAEIMRQMGISTK